MDAVNLAQTLSRTMPAKTVAKAKALQRKRAVFVGAGASGTLVAVVEGTRPYDVELTARDGQVTASCTCEAFEKWGPCKHVLATVLELSAAAAKLDETGGEFEFEAPCPCPVCTKERELEADDGTWTDDDGEDEWDYDSDGRDPLGRKRSRRDELGWRGWTEPEVTLPAWKRLVNTIQSSPNASLRPDRLAVLLRERPDALVYEVDFDRDPYRSGAPIGVVVRTAKLGKNGLPTRGRETKLSRIDVGTLRNGGDRRVVRLLFTLRAPPESGSSAYRYRSYYAPSDDDTAIPRERAGALLRVLARTGRCFVMQGGRAERDFPLRADPGRPWEFVVRREDDSESGSAFIAGALVRGDEVMPLEHVEHWVLPTHFVRGDVLSEVRVGPHGAWLAPLARNGVIEVPAHDLETFTRDVLAVGPPPTGVAPGAELTTGVAAVPVVRIVSTSGRTRPRVRVGFEYDGVYVAAADVAGTVLDGDRLIAREVDAETDALRGIVALPGIVAPKADDDADLAIQKKDLPAVIRGLLDLRCYVELEGHRVRAPGTFQAHVRSGQDWFDIEGGIDYGDEVLPLPDVLASLRKGHEMLRLSDGSHALVPASFEDSWGALSQLAQANDGNLRFARSQGWLLDVLLAARDDVITDAGFESYRERLAAFEGVKPARESRSFSGKLRDYQREGLGWFAFLSELGCGGCLADDMGLGKTIQVLALLERRVARRESGGPSLVVAPRSVVFNWIDEAARFAPRLRVVDYTGTNRAALRKQFAKHDLVVTTYGTLRRDAAHLAKLKFDYAILDEAQAIKNPSSQSFKAARLLRASHRLALTGTPVENRLSDLWSILEFLNPGMLGRSTTFRRVSSAKNGAGAESLQLIGRAVRPFLLRRTKEQVAKDLPERTEQVIHCEMTPQQAKLYAEVRDHYRSTLLSKSGAGGDSPQQMMVLEALLRLRQVACHAGLVGAAAGGRSTTKETDCSGKLDGLLPMLEEATSSGHKALIFSQFTSLLGHVRDRLEAAKMPYLYLDGKTRNRRALVKAFQEDADPRLFLISLKAGGLGLNLTAADYVFLLDPWWNPAVEAQAIDRTHRIGQTRSVVAYRLITAGTVEEKVLTLQAEKRALAEAIVTQENASLADLTREDLELLLS